MSTQAKKVLTEEEKNELRSKFRANLRTMQTSRSGQRLRQVKQELSNDPQSTIMSKTKNKKKQKNMSKLMANDSLRAALKQMGLGDPEIERQILEEINDKNATTIQQVSEVIGNFIKRHTISAEDPRAAAGTEVKDENKDIQTIVQDVVDTQLPDIKEVVEIKNGGERKTLRRPTADVDQIPPVVE